MIKFYEQGSLPEIKDEICSVKANALFKTYGNRHQFLSFWVQLDEKDKVTAVIFSLSGNFTVYTSEDADILELGSFLAAMCQGEILCTDKLGKQLDLKPKKTVFGLKKIYLQKEKGQTEEKSFDDFKRLYAMLKSSDSSSISLPDFDEFYADLRMRFNHRSADFLLGDGYCVAANIFEDSCLITGICVHKDKQGTGCGRKAIDEFAKKVGANSVLVLAEKSVIRFYEKCGFEIIENCGLFTV